MFADHFPDAYAGSNTQIRDTINNLIEKSPQNWHTTIGLPFRRIEGTVRLPYGSNTTDDLDGASVP